jgi:two-component system response regulator VicR
LLAKCWVLAVGLSPWRSRHPSGATRSSITALYAGFMELATASVSRVQQQTLDGVVDSPDAVLRRDGRFRDLLGESSAHGGPRGSQGESVSTILIVDDEEPVRDFLAQFLADVGYRTVQAIHGAQALELVEKERPDLVISDIMMPILNGAELCRLLKARADAPRIAVILMSAAGRRSADGTGADAFIAKPFDLEDMQTLVHRLSSSPDLGPAPRRSS